MNTESYLIRFLFMLYFSYAFQELVYPWSLQSRIVRKRYYNHSLLLRCVHNFLSLPLFLHSSVVPCNNSLDTYPSHSCHKRSNAFWKSMWLWDRSCWWSIYFSIISLMLGTCSAVFRFGQKHACSLRQMFFCLPSHTIGHDSEKNLRMT